MTSTFNLHIRCLSTHFQVCTTKTDGGNSIICYYVFDQTSNSLGLSLRQSSRTFQTALNHVVYTADNLQSLHLPTLLSIVKIAHTLTFTQAATKRNQTYTLQDYSKDGTGGTKCQRAEKILSRLRGLRSAVLLVRPMKRAPTLCRCPFNCCLALCCCQQWGFFSISSTVLHTMHFLPVATSSCQLATWRVLNTVIHPIMKCQVLTDSSCESAVKF